MVILRAPMGSWLAPAVGGPPYWQPLRRRAMLAPSDAGHVLGQFDIREQPPMRPVLLTFVAALLLTPSIMAAEEGFEPLFDGRTLDGWEGDLTIFRVDEGAIVGGTLA